MKTRTGFVSNSSSSSFVIHVGEPFNSVLELAEHMIPQRGYENDQELLEKVRKLKEKGEFIPAVSFHSCNYDTFIAKMDNVFLVETCHNHDWSLYDMNQAPCPPEYQCYFGDDGFYNLKRCLDFLSLEHNVVGHPVHYGDAETTYCKECFTDIWRVGERGMICLKCKKQVKPKKI